MDRAAAEIAHEFNNLLTIMQGNLELLHRQALDERGRVHLEHVEWAVLQAGQLTQQVLSKARQDIVQRRVVDLNCLVASFVEIVRRTVPEEVHLALDLSSQRLPVLLAPGKLELALLNLTRNAVHAMPYGGRIVIQTSEGGSENHPYGSVVLSLADTGTGMTPEVARRATELFFTNKPEGEGTGIGLPMVQSFMAAVGGTLKIDTAEGEGTNIRLIFPRVSASDAGG